MWQVVPPEQNSSKSVSSGDVCGVVGSGTGTLVCDDGSGDGIVDGVTIDCGERDGDGGELVVTDEGPGPVGLIPCVSQAFGTLVLNYSQSRSCSRTSMITPSPHPLWSAYVLATFLGVHSFASGEGVPQSPVHACPISALFASASPE